MKRIGKKVLVFVSVLIILGLGIVSLKIVMGSKNDNTSQNQEKEISYDDVSVPQFANDEEEQAYIEKVIQEDEIIYESSQEEEIDEFSSSGKTYQFQDN